jgi:catechol 2,3-dioxygenase-like lactoylglutathione lyase family enzyme
MSMLVFVFCQRRYAVDQETLPVKSKSQIHLNFLIFKDLQMKSLFKNKKLVDRVTILITVMALIITSPAVKAQAPGIVGIDHVGINVPDIEQASAFFHDMFGFESVTKLGPFTMDAKWKNNFHIHDNAGNVTLVMMRAGDGSNIELFSYKPAAGSTEQPYRDDISATHIAFYTSDIQGAKAFLGSKGIKFLTDINAGGGDTEGESWVYFQTPWGSTIELNTYPAGKGYENKHPVVRLWTATSVVQLTNDTVSAADLKSLAIRQVQVWNDTNENSRLLKVKAIYQDHVVFYDHETVLSGLANLNKRITILQHKNVNFKFSLVKIDNTNNMIRYYWNYGPPSNPKLIAGMDLIILENGKIRSLSVFLDRLPNK